MFPKDKTQAQEGSGPQSWRVRRVCLGSRPPGFQPRGLPSADWLVTDSDSEEVLCQWVLGEGNCIVTPRATPLLQEPQSSQFWNHGI